MVTGDRMAHVNCSHGPMKPNESLPCTLQRLRLVLCLTAAYMVIEFLGGLWTGSLALIADSGHMLADTASLGLAWFATWFANRPASPQKTYGYYRIEIFAAFINSVLLVLGALLILYHGAQRLHEVHTINSGLMMVFALGGLIINLLSAFLLYDGQKQNLNQRAAFLHVLSDSLGSVGSILAGLLIALYGLNQADAFIAMGIGVLILINAWGVIHETADILLEACPKHLDVARIQEALMKLPEVSSVHDLHVWTITSGKEALSVHVRVNDVVHYTADMVTKIQHLLTHSFGLRHVTIQLETPDFEEDEIHF